MIALLAIVIAAAVLFLARSKKSKPAPAPSGWRILYSTGFPDAPTPQGDGAIGPEFLEAT